jgi:polar amino acid transport system substrate-binding protein
VEEHAFTVANPMDYRPVFRSRQVRDDFNAGLKHMKETGRVQAIYDKYLKE